MEKIKDKLRTINIFGIQDNESIICGFYCIAFIDYMLAGKTLLDYTNFFYPNNYRKNGKIIYNYLKINMAEEAILEFRLRKIDKTRNYLLDEIQYNDLMSEKYQKTCNFLNYVEHLLILSSTVPGCDSISAFAPYKYVLIDKIEHEDLFCWCYLVLNCSFFISNPHKYHI